MNEVNNNYEQKIKCSPSFPSYSLRTYIFILNIAIYPTGKCVNIDKVQIVIICLGFYIISRKLYFAEQTFNENIIFLGENLSG